MFGGQKSLATTGQAQPLLRKARPVLSDAALASIYKAFIRSQVEYCCPLWMGAPVTFLNKSVLLEFLRALYLTDVVAAHDKDN